MHIQFTIIFLCLIATTDLSSLAAAQVTKADINPVREPAPVAKGEIFADIDPSCGGVFQDKDHNYWFSGGDQGVYRYDGKPGGTITRFTTKDGLPSDQVGGIQQHAPTGDIILSTSNGFSRFDGRAFITLSAADPSKSKWKLQPDDLWFPAGQDTGAVYRYDGKVMHRLTFPKTAAGRLSLV